MEHLLKVSPLRQSESVGSCKKKGGGALLLAFASAAVTFVVAQQASSIQRAAALEVGVDVLVILSCNRQEFNSRLLAKVSIQITR
mmetsp:Transcript_18699/g.44092  ORF Transcript_18699/g.44092 Transcript_18699/m.44092 type:complete len:85 (-) Transcript_18699:112-366(-)